MTLARCGQVPADCYKNLNWAKLIPGYWVPNEIGLTVLLFLQFTSTDKIYRLDWCRVSTQIIWSLVSSDRPTQTLEIMSRDLLCPIMQSVVAVCCINLICAINHHHPHHHPSYVHTLLCFISQAPGQAREATVYWILNPTWLVSACDPWPQLYYSWCSNSFLDTSTAPITMPVMVVPLLQHEIILYFRSN